MMNDDDEEEEGKSKAVERLGQARPRPRIRSCHYNCCTWTCLIGKFASP